MKIRHIWIAVILAIAVLLSGCSITKDQKDTVYTLLQSDLSSSEKVAVNEAYDVVNNNVPFFGEEDYTTASYETYFELDSLKRCTGAMACIGKDLMPKEPRGSISEVKPTGWHTTRYDFVDGKSLYNRCHLIGFQLTGENANERNLITGTRYMNTKGMLPFENMVTDYIKETNNHVLYRVTPVFEDDNLVATDVLMEAYSVEDSGEGIRFNVLVHNIEPGVIIDYKTGDSRLKNETESKNKSDSSQKNTYILNIKSRKFHLPTCKESGKIKEANKRTETVSRDELISRGYSPCGGCNP